MMASVEPKAQGKKAETPAGILFVEDTEDHFIIAWHQLRKLGITNVVRRVGTVDEMIDYMSGVGVYDDRHEYPLPSVIVLDLRLPKRGGMEAQAWLRSKLKFRNIPIILTSFARHANSFAGMGRSPRRQCIHDQTIRRPRIPSPHSRAQATGAVRDRLTQLGRMPRQLPVVPCKDGVTVILHPS